MATPTTTKASNPKRSRLFQERFGGASTIPACASHTDARGSFAPHHPVLQKGQCGPARLCTLQKRPAPSHNTWQPQLNRAWQNGVKNAAETPTTINSSHPLFPPCIGRLYRAIPRKTELAPGKIEYTVERPQTSNARLLGKAERTLSGHTYAFLYAIICAPSRGSYPRPV